MSYPALTVILVTLSYLIGSIPFGLLIAKFSGKGDVRKQGSGNIGATNVLRVAGKPMAILTLFFDALKGVIPVLIAEHFSYEEIVLYCGVAAVLGHIFPIWLKFKGGKGVATTIAVWLSIHPPIGFIACIAWMITFYKTRYSSLSSIFACLTATLYAVSVVQTESLVNLTILLSIIVIFRHYTNIHNLVKGKENKFK